MEKKEINMTLRESDYDEEEEMYNDDKLDDFLKQHKEGWLECDQEYDTYFAEATMERPQKTYELLESDGSIKEDCETGEIIIDKKYLI